MRTLLWQNYSFSITNRALSLCSHMWHIRSYLSSRSVLTLASWRSNGINQRSMWTFSKKLIQKEYPGSEGKQSKDPTGRTSLCLRHVGHSNYFGLAIVSSPHWKRLAPWSTTVHFSVYWGAWYFEWVDRVTSNQKEGSI